MRALENELCNESERLALGSSPGLSTWWVVSPAQQSNSPILVYFPFPACKKHVRMETIAAEQQQNLGTLSGAASSNPVFSTSRGKEQTTEEERGIGDTTTANNKRNEKDHVTCVGLAERNSFGESVPTVRTCLRFPHTRSPEPCPSWTASPRVTSFQRRVEEKGEMWTPCFSKNNGVSQKGIFFRTCEGISVTNCKDFFSWITDFFPCHFFIAFEWYYIGRRWNVPIKNEFVTNKINKNK